jgi:DNA invertase Pin-like site-specific DNA recombinase
LTTIGYARVSTADHLEIQIAALKAAGCDVIRSEKRSGTSTTGRAELQTVLDFLRKGDCLMVTRIDRLARSIGDLQDIVRSVKAKGATLKATEQPFDTGNIYGEASGLSFETIRNFETSQFPLSAESIAAMRKAFKKAGVEFHRRGKRIGVTIPVHRRRW